MPRVCVKWYESTWRSLKACGVGVGGLSQVEEDELGIVCASGMGC